MDKPVVCIIGGGLFGAFTSLQLHRDYPNCTVLLLDEFSSENSSRDVSKIIRGDYGDDALYPALFARTMEDWREIERKWFYDPLSSGDSPLHFVGIHAVSRKGEEEEGTFERDSLEVLKRLHPKRAAACTRWESKEEIEKFVGMDVRGVSFGYHQPYAGWVETGRVLDVLLEECRRVGVVMINKLCDKIEEAGRRRRVCFADGTAILAQTVVVCAGAWTPFLVPETKAYLKATAQPVFHFSPRSPTFDVAPWSEPGRGGSMAPLMLDIGTTGLYVFPYHHTAKVLKVGHHGDGTQLHEPATKVSLASLAENLRASEEARFYLALKEFFPTFEKDWKVDDFHMCQYCDSKDSHFVIDFIRPNVIVASGGSGHGAKFGPLVGKLVSRLMAGRFCKADELLDSALERFRIQDSRFKIQRYERARVSGVNQVPLSRL